MFAGNQSFGASFLCPNTFCRLTFHLSFHSIKFSKTFSNILHFSVIFQFFLVRFVAETRKDFPHRPAGKSVPRGILFPSPAARHLPWPWTCQSVKTKPWTFVRYAWRTTPCALVQCAVYGEETSLPAGPFVFPVEGNDVWISVSARVFSCHSGFPKSFSRVYADELFFSVLINRLCFQFFRSKKMPAESESIWIFPLFSMFWRSTAVLLRVRAWNSGHQFVRICRPPVDCLIDCAFRWRKFLVENWHLEKYPSAKDTREKQNIRITMKYIMK